MRFLKHTLLLAFFATLGWLAPVATAQTNAIGGSTIDSTIVEDVPDIVTEERKTMWQLIRSGGLMMVPLALLMFYGFYCAGAQVYVILFTNDKSKDNELLEKLDPHELAYEDMPMIVQNEITRRERAAFPKMAEAALNRIYSGKEGMTEALEEEGALQLGRLKRGIKPLQGVVMVAPLLGLLGTVYGMIASFQSMGSAGDDKVKFLSEGIYEALVTTASGLTIAIPFLFLYLWLNRKTDEIGENLNRQARKFLGALFPVEGEGAVSKPSVQDEVELEKSTT